MVRFSPKKILPHLLRKDARTFTVNNSYNDTHTLYLSHEMLSFEKKYAKLNLITFFNKEDLNQRDILTEIQDRYSRLLFVLHLDNNNSNNASFKSSDKTLYKAICHSIGLSSNPNLLTVLYASGKYFSHYEGSIPIEMLQYDIEQAQNKIQQKDD